MTAALVQKLSEIKDLKGIVETTVNELGQSLNANGCQILLANPLDPNSALIFESYSGSGSVFDAKIIGENTFPRLTLPLDINGRGFGTLSLSRSTAWQEDEIDSSRVLAGKIGEIIRQAQLNDIAQRDTFRDTFLVEINNLMTYSLGVGDALFMVVNILGKALRCSRCIFVCTDDKNSGWKCYEYWQQDKVKSCHECHWPTNDSSLIAQTLSSQAPLKFYEGQANSYLTPAQAELQFSSTRSLLALPLLNENNVYGCVIIQQCDYRRDWTVNEVDTVQSVADRVAEALAKLPEEKRIHKPIMQLHQRIVTGAKLNDGAAGSLARSLKGAFGQKSIPSARDVGERDTDTLNDLPTEADTPVHLRLAADTPSPQTTTGLLTADTVKGDKKGLGKKDSLPVANEPVSPAPSIVSVQRKNKIKGSTSTQSAQETTGKASEDAWGDLDAIPTPPAAPGVSGLGVSMLPKVKTQQNLGAMSPLRSSLHKHKLGGAASGTNLPAQSQSPESESNKTGAAEPTAKVAQKFSDTESQARQNVERVLSTKKEEKSSSEYIFAVPNVDLRTLGRINGWVLAIEQKDRYLTPHAVAVAEYASAIAKAIGLSEKQIEEIKLAALVHDVGKLGISGEILQKPDDSLDDAELLTTMKHPSDGADLLSASSDLAALAPIVLAHHEEYGGNGYPQGLKGEEIPLGARIIYIANSYHAMVSDSRTAKGMNAQEAQQQLQNESGKQYDPALVDAFLKHLKHA